MQVTRYFHDEQFEVTFEVDYQFHRGCGAYTPPGEYQPTSPPEPAECEFGAAKIIHVTFYDSSGDAHNMLAFPELVHNFELQDDEELREQMMEDHNLAVNDAMECMAEATREERDCPW